MLVVRLKRIGKKNKPSYRIVVAEHSNAVNGPIVEDLGFYNPHSKQISINKEAITGWLNKGAKPSNTIARLLEKEKVKHKSIVVIKYNKAPKKKVEEAKPATAPAASSDEPTEPATEEAPAEVTQETLTADETLIEEPAETVDSTVEAPAEAEEPIT